MPFHSREEWLRQAQARGTIGIHRGVLNGNGDDPCNDWGFAGARPTDGWSPQKGSSADVTEVVGTIDRRIDPEAQAVEADKTGGIVLIVGLGRVGFHGGDVRVV